MPVTAVVGANWGDEGKGKITDVLGAGADFVVRFQGGSNAGHTIINEHGKFALHLLPSGVFHEGIVNVLGPGVAVDIPVLLGELEHLQECGIPRPDVRISDRAQIVLPYHRLLDVCEEERLGARQFGSTRAGIAPFYADKYLKLGVQIADLTDTDRLRTRLTHSLSIKNPLFEHLYDRPALSVDDLLPQLLDAGRQIAPFTCDALSVMEKAIAEGRHILLEGQLGALRDPNHGIYPYPTSSSPLAGFATVGAGIPAREIGMVIAVAKAYSSCVGAGPFVTELKGERAQELRRRGGSDGEYGATTGRPRRVGWFDAVATRYGCRVQGATEVALTLLDVLGYLDEIPMCTAYEIDGESTSLFPTTDRLEHAKPVWQTTPGWRCDLSNVRAYADLPANARLYVETIERLVNLPVKWISVGPGRKQILLKDSPMPHRN